MWSHDGSILLVGGIEGALSVWRTPDNLLENIQEILGAIAQDPQFWDQFPISLPNRTIKEKE